MVPELGLIVFHDWDAGLRHYAVASVFLAAAMTTVSSVAFFFSCLPIKPAAATIGALSYVLVDMILRNTGFMEDYDHLLLTRHMASWARLLAEEVPWAVVLRSYTVLAAVNASLFVLGAAVFTSRDLKS
jgi:ABC-2 type transport system permease protein